MPVGERKTVPLAGLMYAEVISPAFPSNGPANPRDVPYTRTIQGPVSTPAPVDT